MTRREILKYTAFITGAAVSAPLLGTIVSGCKPEVSSSGPSGLNFFTNKEFALIKDLVDTILPKTDSPSASEVGVHLIIDSMVGNVYNNNDKKDFKVGFDALIKALEAGSGKKDFTKLKQSKKAEVIKEIELSQDEGLMAAKSGLLTLKQQTVSYYLSTSEIATNYLNYLPVPGNYESCVQLADVGGKAWAL